MKTFLKIISTSALIALLSACSGSGRPPEAEKTVDQILAEKNLKIVEEVDKLIGFNIRNWKYVNRQNVVLVDGPSRNYLVELNSPCLSLEFAQVIAFTSYGKIVNRSDYILVTDAPGHTERCMMRRFYTLEKIPRQ